MAGNAPGSAQVIKPKGKCYSLFDDGNLHDDGKDIEKKVPASGPETADRSFTVLWPAPRGRHRSKHSGSACL